ncbi:MAG: phosphoglucosamine mutase [Fervidicoccaceae archaeon]
MSWRLFGTDGVRGVVNETMSAELALRLGASICTVFGEGSRILVGRDVRLGGDMLVNALMAGLESAGCSPIYCGYAPTPAVQYAVKTLGGFDGGAMVTASHNPPMYNGIKVIDGDGIEISREKEREVEEVFREGRLARIHWSRADISAKRIAGVLEHYARGVVECVDSEAIKRRAPVVVVDCANSVGSLVVPKLVRALGGRPISLNSHLDPYFPGREPEPTPDTLVEASSLVVSARADLGVGLDGDADRAIVIDERGEAHWGDRTAALLAARLREKHAELPPVVYTGVSSSAFIESYLSSRGIRVEWMRVGSVDISRELAKRGGLLGFEENGGLMYPPHQFVRDAAMAVALVLELLATERATLSELYGELPRAHALKTKYPMDRVKAMEVVREISAKFSEHRQVMIDGVKVFFSDGWLLARPSGTEPVLRIMVEATTRERAHEILREAELVVREVEKRERK